MFSGDVDGAVSIFGTRQWIKNLNWEIIDPWTPWVLNGQVVGYKEKHNGLDFVTIHGAGHLVPSDKPQAANQMFTSWIHDEKF